MIDALLDQLARQRGIGDAYHNYRGDLVTISRETKTAILAAMGCPVDDATRVRTRAAGMRGRALAFAAAAGRGRPSGEPCTSSWPCPPMRSSSAAMVGRRRVGRHAGAAKCAQGHCRELERSEVRRPRVDAARSSTARQPSARLSHAACRAGADGASAGLRADRRTAGVLRARRAARGRAALGRRGAALHAALAAQLGHRRFRRPRDGRAWCCRHGAASSGSIRCTRCSRRIPGTSARTARRRGTSSTCCTSPSSACRSSRNAPTARQSRGGRGIPGGTRRLRRHGSRRLPRRRARQARRAEAAVRAFRVASTSRGEQRAAAQFHAYLKRARRVAAPARAARRDRRAAAVAGRGRYWGWPVWPEHAARSRTRPASPPSSARTLDRVSSTPGCSGSRTSSWATVQRLARELGMPIGLYGDYAVGVNPSGSETWSDQARLSQGRRRRRAAGRARAEGPGLGHPAAGPATCCVAERYRAVPRRCSPRTCGTSARCGSITSWRCSGNGGCRSASARPHGGYVHYPLDDLMSVLALESEQSPLPRRRRGPRDRAAARCRTRWPSAPCTRTRCCCSRSTATGAFAAREYPRRAIATVTTHDLPTLRGYWTGSDIELRDRLEPVSRREAIRQHVASERAHDRQALLAALAAAGLRRLECDGSPGSVRRAARRTRSTFTSRAAPRRSSCCRSKT